MRLVTTSVLPRNDARPYRLVVAQTTPARVLAMVAIGILAVLALGFHVASVVVTTDGGQVACGSLAAPVDYGYNFTDEVCESAFENQRTKRLAPLVLMGVIYGVVVVTWWVQRHTSAFPGGPIWAVDGPTTVRAARPHDADAIVDTIDDEVASSMGWGSDERERWHQAVVRRTVPVIALTETGSDRPIGAIVASGDSEGGIGLGAWMGADHRGQGHMSRGLRAVAEYFTSRGIVLMAETAEDNVPMRTALDRAGFERIGQRRVRLPDGSDVDGLIFVRYPNDPPKA